jgi:hypothetical protein
MRELTRGEYRAVLAFAGCIGSDEEREYLLNDLPNCMVEGANHDGSILRFHIDGYQRPPHRGQDIYRGRDRFPVQGTVIDADGAEIDVLLFVVHGRVYELELVKQSASGLVAPDWTSFRVK